MTVIYDMVTGSIQSEQRMEAPATGHCGPLELADLPTVLPEVRVYEAVTEPADHGIHHSRSLLHKD